MKFDSIYDFYYALVNPIENLLSPLIMSYNYVRNYSSSFFPFHQDTYSEYEMNQHEQRGGIMDGGDCEG